MSKQRVTNPLMQIHQKEYLHTSQERHRDKKIKKVKMVANGSVETLGHAYPINKQQSFSKNKSSIETMDMEVIEHTSMSASPRDKQFQVRESLITELVKTNHISCAKNLLITYLIFYLFESIVSDLHLYGRCAK